MKYEELALFRELVHATLNLRAAQRGYMQLRASGTIQEKESQGRIVAERASEVDRILFDIRSTLPNVWSLDE